MKYTPTDVAGVTIVRGLHRQAPPYAEAKLVRCTRGTIVDVAVDVRPESRTYRKHVMVQLSAENHRALIGYPSVYYAGTPINVDFEMSGATVEPATA